jgi:tetratricopeptide (TPR) repeat protein
MEQMATAPRVPVVKSAKLATTTTGSGSNLSLGEDQLVTPLRVDFRKVMPRADEVNTIQRMLNDKQTGAVALVGAPGSGKSTLAALFYRRAQLARQQGQAAPSHFVWLTINNYTTVPEMIYTILECIGVKEPGFYFLKPEQQVSTLLRALRRPHEGALIVLDQFELLLHPEVNQGVAGRGVLTLFLEMFQTHFHDSRILLTSYTSPFDEENDSNVQVRTYLVSRINLPEGVALLKHYGVVGEPEKLSFVWQRCTGHVFALILFSALVRLSGLAPQILMDAPEYKRLWADDVTNRLITGIFYYLHSNQQAVLRVLSLFHEAVPKEALFMAIAGSSFNIVRGSDKNPSKAELEQELENLVQMDIVQRSYLPAWYLDREAAPGEMSRTYGYSLHPLLRQYVQEHFLADNELEEQAKSGGGGGAKEAQKQAIADCHLQIAAYYVQVAEHYCPAVENCHSLQDVRPILFAIRHQCQGRRWQSACETLFAESLNESMVSWGVWNVMIGLYTAMLPPFGVLLKHDEGLVASNMGTLYGRLGEYQQSQRYFDQALNLQKQIGDKSGEAVTLTNEGELLRTWGKLDEAKEHFTRALDITKETADPHVRCVIQHNLGLLAHQEHDYQQALEHYATALHLANVLQRDDYQGLVLTNIGLLLYEQSQHYEALAVLFAACNLRQSLHDPTVTMLERFLMAIEQKIGHERYEQASLEALEIQTEVLSRFLLTDMRQ